MLYSNEHWRVQCLDFSEPHCQSEAKYKVFIVKISFNSYANKTNFHMESLALTLAFIMRFTATRKSANGLFNVNVHEV